MADQWEMLTLTVNEVYIFYSKGHRKQTIKEFLREKDKDKGTFKDVISIVLADGWEPFATGCYGVDILNYSFRRKCQG
jgi:hypothetical protein